MLAIASLFVFGAFWFWVALAIVVGVVFWNVEHEDVGLSLFSIAAFTMLVTWANKISLISLLSENLPFVLLCVLGYFALGTGWSIAKWYFFIRRYVYAFREAEAEYMHLNNLTATDPNDKRFREFVIDRFNKIPGNYKSLVDTYKFPRAAERKKAILGWMMYWPISATWTLINDPVRRAFITIYNYISSSLDRMTARITRDIVTKVDLSAPAEQNRGGFGR